MKVKQIVDEHKKGFRAKKYAHKPKNTIAPKKPEPIKPVGTVKPGDEVKETAIAGQMVGKVSKVDPATGKVDVQSPTGQTTTVDATQITPGDTPNKLSMQVPNVQPGMEVDAAKTIEENPEAPYYVDVSSGKPMAKTGGSGMTQIVPSKMWTAITPEIEAKAHSQGFRKVMLQMNNKQYTGLEGGDQALGSKIIVAPSDFDALKAGPQVNMRKSMGVQSAEKTGIGAPPMRESVELDAIKRLSGL
jgi:hypothetical protein